MADQTLQLQWRQARALACGPAESQCDAPESSRIQGPLGAATQREAEEGRVAGDVVVQRVLDPRGLESAAHAVADVASPVEGGPERPEAVDVQGLRRGLRLGWHRATRLLVKEPAPSMPAFRKISSCAACTQATAQAHPMGMTRQRKRTV
eukprot:4960635-Lingulodinium_polyedra.AAC.1